MKYRKNLFIIFILFFLFEPLKAGSFIQNIIKNSFPNMKIEKFKTDSNSFSATLNRNGNIYKILGTLSPLEADIGGNLKSFSFADKKIVENMKLDAHLKNRVIKGNFTFSNYIGKLLINLNTGIDIFDVKNVDIKYICSKLGLFLPKYLKGKTDIHIKHFKNKYEIKLYVKGFYKTTPLQSNINLVIEGKNIKMDGTVKSKVLEGRFNLSKKDKVLYSGDFKKIPLGLFSLLYPFRGVVNLKIKNDNDNIVKFTSQMFSGFYDQKVFNITFEMPAEDFFNYVNLSNVFRMGNINGNLNISKKGDFNFIIEDAVLKREIRKKINLNMIFNKIFVKGSFNKKEAVFDLLFNDNTLYVNIKNGKLIINNDKIKPDFTIVIKKNGALVKYKINSRGIFLIEKKVNKNPDDDVLIY